MTAFERPIGIDCQGRKTATQASPGSQDTRSNGPQVEAEDIGRWLRDTWFSRSTRHRQTSLAHRTLFPPSAPNGTRRFDTTTYPRSNEHQMINRHTMFRTLPIAAAMVALSSPAFAPLTAVPARPTTGSRPGSVTPSPAWITSPRWWPWDFGPRSAAAASSGRSRRRSSA